MKARAYVKSFLANRQRYFPDQELDETVEIIKRGMEEKKPKYFIALDVHRYLGHTYVGSPYSYFVTMVTGTITHMKINNGIINTKGIAVRK
jgi:hypothetical protein